MWAYWVKQLILSTFGSLMKYDAWGCQKHCFHRGVQLVGCVGSCRLPVLSLSVSRPLIGLMEGREQACARACVWTPRGGRV